MYRNVLVGVDQRDGSRDAIALALALAPHCQRMSLINIRNEYYPGMRGIAPDEDAAGRQYSLESLRSVRDEAGVDAEMLSIAATSVGRGIKDAAERIEADLIVVGSCHRSAIGRVVSGNDATSTLHHAPCTVAIAPHGYVGLGAAIETVGVAYDGSPQSVAALAAARLLREDVGAKALTACDVEEITIRGYGWVVPYIEGRDMLIAEAQRRLGELAGVDLEVVVGVTGDELVLLSKKVDVLVCGSRGRDRVTRVVLGSASDHLVHHARSPLVVVPAVAEIADCDTEDELAATTASRG